MKQKQRALLKMVDKSDNFTADNPAWIRPKSNTRNPMHERVQTQSIKSSHLGDAGRSTVPSQP